jgi:hypothetical protein
MPQDVRQHAHVQSGEPLLLATPVDDGARVGSDVQPWLPSQQEGAAAHPDHHGGAARLNGVAHRPSAHTRLTLSIVIPTLNEAGNVGHVLQQLGRFDEVILVDGHSTDGTVDIARSIRPDIHVVERAPRGKGDALRAGFAAASGEVIVMMDADGSMDPNEVDAFVALIGLGYDLVKGSRSACGGGSHDLTMIRFLGNRALCQLANSLFRTSWTDLCYGFVAFRRSCLPKLALTANGFEIETQILVHAALAHLRIAEIPSVELPRLSGDSHLNARRDGVRVLRTILGARLSPRARRVAVQLRPLPLGNDAGRIA